MTTEKKIQQVAEQDTNPGLPDCGSYMLTTQPVSASLFYTIG